MEQVNAATTRRGTRDGLRTFVEQEASALFITELARRQEEWRSALASVKQTLAGLETTCETLMTGAPDRPAEAVSALIERIVAAAAADAESLAQQVEARAKAEISEAQAVVVRLQADVRAADEQLTLAREQLDLERAARVRAESSTRDAQVAHEKARAALEGQLRSHEAGLQASREEVSALQQRLAAAQAEGANTSATLESLQRAVHGAMSTLTVVQPAAAASGRPEPNANAARSDAVRPPVPDATTSKAGASSSGKAKRAGIADVLLNEVPTSRYATALLKSVEATYEQDLKSALPPADVVKRLTDNLRYASQIYAERLRSDPAGDASALNRQLAELVRARSATPFGCDLAIAAAAEAERQERRDQGAAPHVPVDRR
jgi:hypothetical protein